MTIQLIVIFYLHHIVRMNATKSTHFYNKNAVSQCHQLLMTVLIINETNTITQCHQRYHVYHVCAELVLKVVDNHFHKYHRYVFSHATSSCANYNCLNYAASDRTIHKHRVSNLCGLIHGPSILLFRWNPFRKLGKYVYGAYPDHVFWCGFADLYDYLSCTDIVDKEGFFKGFRARQTTNIPRGIGPAQLRPFCSLCIFLAFGPSPSRM